MIRKDKAYEAYLKVYDLGENPLLDARSGQTPVGLKASYLIPTLRRAPGSY